MDLSVEIETSDGNLAFDLLEGQSLSQKKVIADGITVAFRGEQFSKAADLGKTLELAVSIGGQFVNNAAAGLLAAWLYDKLKGKKVVLRIERRVVQLEKDEIRKVIEEKIEIETKG